MTIASGSSHGMAYVAEVTYGTTPATPAFKYLRHTATTLGLSKDSFQSQELRSDRQIADFRHGTRQVGGDASCELSFGAFDDLLEAALAGTWTADVLKTGTTRRSFTIERKFGDIGQYLRYTGVEFDGFSLTAQPSGIVTINFPVIGQDQSGASAAIVGATYTDAGTGSPFDGFSGSLKEGGTTIAVCTEIQLQLQNGLAAQYVMGSDKTIRPSWGRSNVTGTATMFFEDLVMLNKFVNETNSSLEFTLGDGTSTLNFKIPRLKYSGGKPDVQNEGSITLAMPFQGLLDTVTGIGAMLNFLPGRASGGQTAANSLYEVNEKGPELYTYGSKTYLMAGGKGGFVTPVTRGANGWGGEMPAAPSHQRPINNHCVNATNTIDVNHDPATPVVDGVGANPVFLATDPSGNPWTLANLAAAKFGYVVKS